MVGLSVSRSGRDIDVCPATCMLPVHTGKVWQDHLFNDMRNAPSDDQITTHSPHMRHHIDPSEGVSDGKASQ